MTRLLLSATLAFTCVLSAQTPSPQPSAQQNVAYQRGRQALEARQWDNAISSFDSAAALGGNLADGALYWKAYALEQAGQLDQAMKAVQSLEETFPTSRWANDAAALNLELRGLEGLPVSPDVGAGDDIKALALNSLLQTDPSKALPSVERLLKSNSSSKLKGQALFVLAQSGSPEARRILLEVARDSAHPDLQSRAIQYLGLFGGKATGSDLVSLYHSANPQGRKAILNSLFLQQNGKALVDLARQETDPAMKREIIRRMGLVHSTETTDYLVEALQ